MRLQLDTVRPDRRTAIMEKAAHLFGAKGYGGTSMRDIASSVGALPGSVYHHFASKEALLAAIHEQAIDGAIAAIARATTGIADPWDRLEAAAACHLRMLLSAGTLAAVVADAPGQEGASRAELVRQRDRYEAVFRGMVGGLDLPPSISPTAFRLALLGALNWALTWFRPDGDTPEVVARDLFAPFRANRPHPT